MFWIKRFQNRNLAATLNSGLIVRVGAFRIVLAPGHEHVQLDQPGFPILGRHRIEGGEHAQALLQQTGLRAQHAETESRCRPGQRMQDRVHVVHQRRVRTGRSDGLLELVPSARVGHIGVFRDPDTHEPVEYMVRLPDTLERTFILCDPMVATGNSAVHAIDVLKKRGVPDEHILFLALVAAPEGVQVVQQAHPNVKLYVAALDSHLDQDAYIVPGLGDAGDRIFGTK